MTDTILIGRGKIIEQIPRAEWEQELKAAPAGIAQRLAFMEADHHRVRNFVVQELPRRGRPISLDAISEALGISPERTATIVGDLERNLFFLVRAGGEEVSWVFPVTVDDTGHRLVFSTGERLDAA